MAEWGEWDEYKKAVSLRRKEAEDYIGYDFQWEDDETFEAWEIDTENWLDQNGGGHIQNVLDDLKEARDAYYKPFVLKIENYYLNAKYNPRTPIGEKFANALYNENFSSS